MVISISIHLPNRAVTEVVWDKPVLTLGRAPGNDIIIPAENVSSRHAQIYQGAANEYIARDLKSRNGTILVRGGKNYLLGKDYPEMPLHQGDRLCLASLENQLILKDIKSNGGGFRSSASPDETIIAEQRAIEPEFVPSEEKNVAALQATVLLARALVGKESSNEIGELLCKTALEAFPGAQRALYLTTDKEKFAVDQAFTRKGKNNHHFSVLLNSQRVLERCLAEQKGFIYVINKGRIRSISTHFSIVEAISELQCDQNVAILCCPLIYQERCYGFLELEAPHEGENHAPFSRQELSIGNLISHLVAARLYDLESQRRRLKLTRKATAGFMAATVGHCFKNLMSVPMSFNKMLPHYCRLGQMERVEWMLACSSVAMGYMENLANEFASVSKDPLKGFAQANLSKLMSEVSQFINQISPAKLEAKLNLPESVPEVICHSNAVKRTLMNLALNAVDAIFNANMPHKGLIELAIEYDQPQDMMLLFVHDNGPGIPEPILEHLNNIFRQVQASSDAIDELQGIAEQVCSSKQSGFKEHYGLGFLFVCLTVHQHQGWIEIESSPGAGTGFCIGIPRQPPPAVINALSIHE